MYVQLIHTYLGALCDIINLGHAATGFILRKISASGDTRRKGKFTRFKHRRIAHTKRCNAIVWKWPVAVNRLVCDTLATRCDCRRRSATHCNWKEHVESRCVAVAVNCAV